MHSSDSASHTHMPRLSVESGQSLTFPDALALAQRHSCSEKSVPVPRSPVQEGHVLPEAREH